ncbi:inositol polyphosphate 5-phosphatase, putative [Entamoeba histolytica HM-3:IMSS]|uniref:Inositol polyphosphate 5-phosphatase, putative n=1 Tax=Entamoeba histolytica HM-3:IMSS TaxID=885315 RepID=M7W5E8_ENTHI|nr:inositol polyphosphate 5-phosphatase, putative [Entamoeba histolytica HM-3:IMSS]
MSQPQNYSFSNLSSRRTVMTPKFMLEHERLTEQVQASVRTTSTPPSLSTTPKEHERKEWIKSHRTTTSLSSYSRRTSSNAKQFLGRSKTLEEDNEMFKPTTPPSPSFVPVVPRMWVAMNRQPTKEEICKSPEIYKDFNCFAEDSQGWKEKSILDQLPFYAIAKELKIQICTWNINQGLYDQEIVDKWTSLLSEKPDIVALGVQELDMSVDAIITGKKYSERAEQWKDVICKSVNRNGGNEYDESGWYQLCGIVLFVFVHKHIKSQIKMFGLSECRTGAMSGKLANKGGVAIGMKIYDSTICFVNSHLAAHQEFCERRNKDWEEISKMKIKYYNGTSSLSIPLLQHDVVIWMGDLNYRIDMEDSEVRKLVQEKDLTTLYRNDQLFNSRMKKKVFQNFKEAKITFLPTFKIKIGNGEYVDNRIPSWCDRVLYKTERRHGVIVEKYTSFELYNSDHKPVSAFMKVYLQQINQEKKKMVEEFMDKAEKWYSMVVVPEVSASMTYFEFRGVNVLTEYSQEITIVNTGKSRLHLTLIQDEQKENLHLWAKVQMSTDRIEIMEGKDTAKVKVSIKFDLHSAHLYQEKEACKFAFEIGIKYTKHTIPIVVKVYPKQSCIGMSLKSLSLLNRPVRGNVLNSYQGLPFTIPKEIYRLVDKLLSLSNEELQNCFIQKSTPTQRQEVLDSIDKDSQFLPGILASSYLDILLVVLAGFQDSLLHDNFISEIKYYVNNLELAKRYVIYMMEETHRNVFLYILKTIKELIERGLDRRTVIHLFGLTILHTKKDDYETQQMCERILTLLLDSM